MKRDYNKKTLRIFIGVGHGGTDPGAINTALALEESGINLTIAMLMQYDLKRHGVQVELSRYTDTDDPLKEEIAECNAYAPDFAVEIHTNAGGGSGFEVYYQLEPWEYSQASLQMAKRFDTNVCKYLNRNTRGLKTDRNLGWLKQVHAPCILVENFFIDGPGARWYSQPEQLEKLSKAYVRSVLEFFGIPYIADNTATLRYKIVNEDLNSARNCTCPAVLINGNYYVQLRPFSRNLGFAVYYEEQTKKILLYPPEYYAESEFRSGLLRISDFETSAERILAGIGTEETDPCLLVTDNKEDTAC